MYEVELPDGAIVSFDGRIVEYFGRNPQRFHLSQVKKVETKRERKHSVLHVDANPFGGFMVHYGAFEDGKVGRLVKEIKAAQQQAKEPDPFY